MLSCIRKFTHLDYWPSEGLVSQRWEGGSRVERRRCKWEKWLGSRFCGAFNGSLDHFSTRNATLARSPSSDRRWPVVCDSMSGLRTESRPSLINNIPNRPGMNKTQNAILDFELLAIRLNSTPSAPHVTPPFSLPVPRSLLAAFQRLLRGVGYPARCGADASLAVGVSGGRAPAT